MKGVIKNMKEQFLNLSGLTELVTYIKLCIAQHKMIIPRASFSLFPKTGDENNIYIDTSTNSIYRWNDSDKSFVLLAKPPRNISISEGKNNGQITLKVDEIESNATVHGLKSAAFSNASSFATSAQGAKADSAIQSITIAPGTNNGTVKITVNGVTTDNIKVAGLGSAAFSDIAVFAPAKHTHSKSDVGLGNVDNTADIDKSVKYAGSSGSSNTVVYTALTNTDLNTLQTEGRWYYAGGGNTCTNIPVASAAFELYVGRNASGWRYQQFTVTSGEIYIRVFDSSNWGSWRKLAFTSDTVTAASSVPWSGITGKPTTFTPASHTHNYAGSSSAGGTANASYKLSNVGQITTVDALNNFNEANVFKYATMSALDGLNGLGKNDGIILSAPWSSANYGHQIFLDDNSYTIAHRYRNSGTWSAWKTLIDSSNIGSQSVSHASTADSTTTATQLSSSAGSATQPVYFSGGKPVATTYTLGKSVPSNAVFTDTNTWRGIQNNLTSDSTTDSLSAAQGKVLKGLVDGKAASSHTHAIAQISNLQTTLDGKSNTNHTHDLNQMINTLTNGTSDPADTDYYIAQYAGGGSTTTTYHRRPHSALWNYIKSKANSVYQPKGSYAASSHTHDDRYYTESEINTKLASKSDTSHTHNYVVGSYTGNGGQQKPNYFGTNKVGFLMMNTTVNGDSNYKDWIIMDCYGGNDVGGSVALGVNRQKLAAYIMRSAAERSSWAESAELLHTLNYTSYTVTKTGSGASGTWGISISGTAAKANSVPWSGVTGKPSSYPPSSHTHSSVTDIGNGSTTTFAYSKSGLGYGDFTWLAAWNGHELRAVNKSLFAQASHSHTVSQISDFGTHVYDATISRTANTVLAAPNGKAGSASFRALVAADIPSITKSKITDFPSSLPASDVYAWAKASSKPSYSWGEITGKPSTFTPSSHNHSYLTLYGSRPANINFSTSTNGAGAMFHFVATSSTKTGKPPEDSNVLQMNWDNNGGWDTQFAISNGSSPHSYIRSQNNGTWGNWTTLLDSSNYNNYSPSKTGTGASGTWGINITGASGSCTGNAATASNASKVNGHTVNSDVPSGAKFTDTNTWRPLGTAANTACAGNDSRLSNSRPASDVYSWAKASSKPSYSWSEITSKPSTFTPASHTHAYIPLSGGTITGSIIRSSGGSWISARNNVAVRGTATGKDSWNPVVGQATPNGYWTIGNLASNDNLAFSYTSNTNYNAGNNSATTVYLPVQEGTIITSATIGSQSVKYATSAGSAGSVAWGNVSGKPSSYTPSSHTHDDRYYTETEINTKLGAKLGAVSANGYYGMARPDGNTSDWIRTTTAGIIPYQSGGAGAGHCGLGTSSWYFSNAYIDTVNCVNASVSGHIDVGGYIQSSNLINTYFEYQSNRGTIDWRFGSATGTGDENFFGFYDAKTGKIPLALDGNFGNIYVGFNVGSYESPTAVGVYLGGQVAGNRAFIYNGDSYQGSIWIQTRLDGSWKWFSLGRVCSTALSDIRLKGNIRDTEVEDATKVIESMKIRSFERKDSHKKYKIGFIADELEQLDPNLIDGGGEVDGHPDYKSVNNLQMLAYVVKGMQELNSKVTILEQENKRLKQKLNMCN